MIFTYKCSCGKQETRVYKIGQSPQYIKCQCGYKAWKEIEPPTIQFRGEGWSCKPEKEEVK